MKAENRNSIIWKGLIFLFVLILFMFTSSEDRLYKQWISRNSVIFNSYSLLKRYCTRNFIPGDKVLIDMSELKKIDEPFSNPILGRMRKWFYFRLQEEWDIHSARMKTRITDYQVEILNPSRRFMPYRAVSMRALNRIRYDEGTLGTFMMKNEIPFYICHFKNWRGEKRTMEAAGFRLVYNNSRFMLFRLNGIF